MRRGLDLNSELLSRSFEFDAVETLSKFMDGGLPNAAAFLKSWDIRL